MSKKLIVANPEQCTGCELCVFQAQAELKRVGLEGSPVRILRVKKDKPVCVVDLDPNVNKLDIEKVKASCPKFVFELQENET